MSTWIECPTCGSRVNRYGCLCGPLPDTPQTDLMDALGDAVDRAREDRTDDGRT